MYFYIKKPDYNICGLYMRWYMLISVYSDMHWFMKTLTHTDTCSSWHIDISHAFISVDPATQLYLCVDPDMLLSVDSDSEGWFSWGWGFVYRGDPFHWVWLHSVLSGPTAHPGSGWGLDHGELQGRDSVQHRAECGGQLNHGERTGGDPRTSLSGARK